MKMLATEKAYTDELERICGVIKYSKVDDGKDLEYCRNTIGNILVELAQFRAAKAARRAAKKPAPNKR